VIQVALRVRKKDQELVKINSAVSDLKTEVNRIDLDRRRITDQVLRNDTIGLKRDFEDEQEELQSFKSKFEKEIQTKKNLIEKIGMLKSEISVKSETTIKCQKNLEASKLEMTSALLKKESQLESAKKYWSQYKLEELKQRVLSITENLISHLKLKLKEALATNFNF